MSWEYAHKRIDAANTRAMKLEERVADLERKVHPAASLVDKNENLREKLDQLRKENESLKEDLARERNRSKEIRRFTVRLAATGDDAAFDIAERLLDVFDGRSPS